MGLEDTFSARRCISKADSALTRIAGDVGEAYCKARGHSIDQLMMGCSALAAAGAWTGALLSHGIGGLGVGAFSAYRTIEQWQRSPYEEQTVLESASYQGNWGKLARAGAGIVGVVGMAAMAYALSGENDRDDLVRRSGYALICASTVLVSFVEYLGKSRDKGSGIIDIDPADISYPK